MTGFSRILGHRTVVATAFLAVLLLGYSLWGTVASARKFPPDEQQAALRMNAAVELAFPPEAFHMQRLQRIGRVMRVNQREVLMRDATVDGLADLARNYWVRDIRPWSGAN
jgi:ribulose kinase